MAEQNFLNWDEIDVSEDVTEEDHKASESITSTTPVGRFIVTVASLNPFEKTMKAYTCVAAKTKFRIDKVLSLEQPLLDGNGNAVKKDGEIVQKVQLVTTMNSEKIDQLFAGQFITDDINLAHPKEKEGMKSRRLFIAKRLRLIDQNAKSISTKVWSEAAGCQCIIETEWNMWEDKMIKGKINKNVKVKWDGYDFAPTTGGDQEGNNKADTSFNTEEFDI